MVIMTNINQENIHLIQQQCDEFKPIIADIYDKDRNVNEDINNNEVKEYKISVSLNSISNHDNKKPLSMDIDFNEIPLEAQEWLITDSITRKHRAPRQNEFLLLLLENLKYSSYVTWIDKSQGLFKINRPDQVAKLWNKVKNRHTNGLMDYETFARGIRFYYKSGQMIKTHKKQTFRFKLPLMNIV